MPRTERDYRALCKSEGLHLQTIEQRGGHMMLRFASGVVFAPCTPSDNRNLKNLRAVIRRLHIHPKGFFA